MPKRRVSGEEWKRTLRRRAEELMRLDPGDVSRMSRQGIQALVHELQVHQAEIEVQNEELREAQLRLADSLERYSDLYDFAPVGYVALDQKGTILDANLAAAALLDRDRGKLVGAKLSRFVLRDDQDAFHRHRIVAQSGETRQSCEVRVNGGSGACPWVRLESVGYPDPRDGSRRTRTALIDVSGLRQAEEEIRRFSEDLEGRVAERTAELEAANRALSESKQRLDDLIDNTPDAIVTFDRDGTIQTANPAARLMFGYGEEALAGHEISRLLPVPFAGEPGRGRKGKKQGRKATVLARRFQATARRRDGSMFPADILVNEAFPVPGLVFSVIRDMTERVHLERQVLHIAEERQREIGHELHDSVLQELSGLALLAQDLSEALSARSAPEAKRARRIAQGMNQVNRELRLLTRGLVPAEVDPEGLLAALISLAGRVKSQHHTVCAVECDGAPRVLDTLVSTQLFRIAQEAVANAVRHARADEIRIGLYTANGPLRLEIADNGTGIARDRKAGEGMGLQIMSYRATLIGASLRFEQREGGGTMVSCVVTGSWSRAGSDRPPGV